jgi:hypothetical protein
LSPRHVSWEQSNIPWWRPTWIEFQLHLAVRKASGTTRAYNLNAVIEMSKQARLIIGDLRTLIASPREKNRHSWLQRRSLLG